MEIKTEKEYIDLYRKSENTDEEKKAIKEYNQKLIQCFPFLKPLYIDNYDFSRTLLDDMPIGWRIAFGLQMCLEMREELIKQNRLNTYSVSEVKEKYGSLRWYDNGCNNELFVIIQRYEKLSAITCNICGKPAAYNSTGWILPFCEDCAQRIFKDEEQYYTKDLKFEDRFVLLNK